jgi:hypothetical protein
VTSRPAWCCSPLDLSRCLLKPGVSCLASESVPDPSRCCFRWRGHRRPYSLLLNDKVIPLSPTLLAFYLWLLQMLILIS